MMLSAVPDKELNNQLVPSIHSHHIKYKFHKESLHLGLVEDFAKITFVDHYT